MNTINKNNNFYFKKFSVQQNLCSFKLGTDAILLGAWVKVHDNLKILDVGTGSGIIALMLAQRNSTSTIVAIDILKENIEQAHINFKNSPWVNRLIAIHVSLQDYAKISKTLYDLIVCNPPFYKNSMLTCNDLLNISRHQQTLTFYELIHESTKLLSNNGRIAVVLPSFALSEFNQIAIKHQLFCNKILRVRSKPNSRFIRILAEFEKKPDRFHESCLTIYDEHNNYSDEFIRYTQDFYIIL